jgi:hypothetical protein
MGVKSGDVAMIDICKIEANDIILFRDIYSLLFTSYANSKMQFLVFLLVLPRIKIQVHVE